MNFLQTMINVAVMMLYAVPSFIMVRTKLLKEDSAASFSKLLLYCCQPCLMFYSVTKISFEGKAGVNMLLAAGLSLILQLAALAIMLLILRKKYDDPKYRVYSIASCFGNVGFFGVPLIEMLLPDMPEAVGYVSMTMLTMNLLAWTMGIYIMTRDKRYMKLKKAILNPSTIALIVALPFFLLNIKLPVPLNDAISLVAKTCMPLSMTVLGIRLATMNLKEIFLDGNAYLFSAIKLIALPLFCFGATYFLPISSTLKIALFIACCTPTANVCLSFAEIYKTGQKPAANIVLLSTFLCVLTVPLMALLLQAF